ncbi:hypothetical protein DNTS_031793, partial [Danionella cerebrum]
GNSAAPAARAGDEKLLTVNPRFHQVDEHITELLSQMFPLGLGPVRETLGYLPTPLKQLCHLTDFTH